MPLRNLLLAAPVVALIAATGTACAQEQPPWQVFLQGVRDEARQAGIGEATLAAALSGLEPVERVLELDRHQPEGTITFSEYMEKRLPARLIETARQRYAQHRPLLDAIAFHYGLDAEAIVALWGLETRFGSYTGGFDVIAAVATLAWDARRSAFFRGELMAALTILDQGHIGRDDMMGSWAGAMGQSQFMPSSFRAYAVDWDLDGRRDIWTNKGDVFASAANYLARAGWRRGEAWGGEVVLPPGFDVALADHRNPMPLAAWLELGVTWAGTPPPMDADAEASLALPGGEGGPAWLVFNNYRAVLKWNRSDYFAMSVFALADALAPG